MTGSGTTMQFLKHIFIFARTGRSTKRGAKVTECDEDLKGTWKHTSLSSVLEMTAVFLVLSIFGIFLFF